MGAHSPPSALIVRAPYTIEHNEDDTTNTGGSASHPIPAEHVGSANHLIPEHGGSASHLIPEHGGSASHLVPEHGGSASHLIPEHGGSASHLIPEHGGSANHLILEHGGSANHLVPDYGGSETILRTEYGHVEILDKDFRRAHDFVTQRENGMPEMVYIWWSLSVYWTDSSWLQSSFDWIRDPRRWSPFFGRNVAPQAKEPQHDDAKRKVNKFVKGRFAILVEMLCALLSSLLVTVYHQRRAEERGGEACGPEPRLPQAGDEEELWLILLGSVLRKEKNYVMFDDCNLPDTTEKNPLPYHWWPKMAKKECVTGLKTEVDDCSQNLMKDKLRRTVNEAVNDCGEKFMKDKLRRTVGLFDRFLPGCVSGLVYPVSRQRSERGPHAGTGSQPRTHPTPQGLSSADTQWPPDSMHDTPWITFRQELYRLGTFLNLPQDFPVSPLKLAQAGFLRLANESIVCFFCGLIRNEWSSNESPLIVHRQLRPDCPLVTGVNCDNVSVMDVEPMDQLAQAMQRFSVQGGASQMPSANGAQGGDLSEDGSPQVPEAGAQSRTTPAAAGGRSSGSANQNGSSGPSSQQTSRPPQPPRLGLMGGAPSSAATLGEFRVMDGTAQPDPPAPEVQNPPTTDSGRQVVTYKELGIITDTPKRPDMATVDSRLATYRGWPDTLRPTPTQFVEAGLYYAGYSDCGRCFFCAGGLMNWEPTDDPWVAHARCFPTCAYLIQCQGQEFVDVVRELSRAENDSHSVSMSQVTAELTRRHAGDPSQDVRTDPAVSSAVRFGFSQQAAEAAAHRMLSEGQQLSVVRLMDILEADGAQAAAAAAAADPVGSISDNSMETYAQVQGEVEALQAENSGLRQREMCKICLDRPASVIFLPCGHLVTCATCCPALHACPLCRQTIRGRVRAFPV